LSSLLAENFAVGWPEIKRKNEVSGKLPRRGLLDER